jgi:DNA-binding transcriptional MerR regulator
LLYWAVLPSTAQIPNRALFRQPEVCEIAQVQPYVLRSWEAEFPDLGVSKTQGAPRVYRRSDVERVLRIKHLLFVEGLTLAGARRKILDDGPSLSPEPALDDLLASDARQRILSVRKALRELSAMLAQAPGKNGGAGEFELAAPTPRKPPPAKRPSVGGVSRAKANGRRKVR